MGEPALLLADEPTGNLDTASGAEIMALLDGLVRDRGVAVVVVTHDPDVAAMARRRVAHARRADRATRQSARSLTLRGDPG